jgi:hypothetical protein
MTFEAGRTPGGWLASDGRWYPAEVHPNYQNQNYPTYQSYPTSPSYQLRLGGSEQTRLRIIRIALAAGIVAGCAGIAALLSTNSAAANDLIGKSAIQVRAIARGAAQDEQSVHVSAFNNSIDANAIEGRQLVSSGAQGNATILVVSGVAYLDGDANFLQNALGLSSATASTYVGKWISLRPTDPAYQQVAAGLTMGTLLVEALPNGPVKLTPTTTIDGQSVVGIVYNLSEDGVNVSETTYVSTAAPNLIVESVNHASKSGVAVTTKATFSRWGESVVVAAPSGAVPISSIVTSGNPQ